MIILAELSIAEVMALDNPMTVTIGSRARTAQEVALLTLTASRVVQESENETAGSTIPNELNEDGAVAMDEEEAYATVAPPVVVALPSGGEKEVMMFDEEQSSDEEPLQRTKRTSEGGSGSTSVGAARTVHRKINFDMSSFSEAAGEAQSPKDVISPFAESPEPISVASPKRTPIDK